MSYSSSQYEIGMLREVRPQINPRLKEGDEKPMSSEKCLWKNQGSVLGLTKFNWANDDSLYITEQKMWFGISHKCNYFGNNFPLYAVAKLY